MAVLDMAFSGGGTKGIAHAGALDVLEQKRFEFRRLIGTSAGAIAASLGACGVTARDYLAMVPARKGEPAKFAEFIAPPSGSAVAERIKRPHSETRQLLRTGF